ncbi:unnamed protein product [Mytilus coruscus]|uniref:Reverse transcriptase domain-containing protein n=1 Tax=Mytilus coruscus TaxID=42192 RepID=A0A6J8A366_MYTCO|nr:unnamed protein product [Mytilus coruscus]
MDCDYGNTEDILIDLIISGVRHSKVQERMLDKGSDLTIAKAIEIGQQFELSQKQLKMIRGEEILHISEHAYDKKKDHKVHNSCDSGDEILYILTVKTETWRNSEDRRIEDVQIGDKALPVRIDTGAKCIIISKKSLNKLELKGKMFEITDSRKILKSYTGHKIQQIGKIRLPVIFKDLEIYETFEIVDMEQDNVISGDLAKSLNLVKRIDTIDTIEEIAKPNELSHDFPELVKTTGTLPGEYRLTIAENQKGVVHAPRQIPAAFKEKAIAELRNMEENGYITKVEEPTEWVSSMVVAVKKDKVRICTDPKDLNEVIQRENYPLKTIKDVIPLIPDAKVFLVLDAKSGFLQIKLEKPYSYLTTFNTPIGRYRWLRLPFGKIKSAPEDISTHYESDA